MSIYQQIAEADATPYQESADRRFASPVLLLPEQPWPLSRGMSLQHDRGAKKLVDTPCGEAYTNSLKCELFPERGHQTRPAICSSALSNTTQCSSKVSHTPTCLLATAAPAAAAASLRRWHSLFAGLDKNNYDKRKCQAEFDAYKKCKKDAVSWAGLSMR